MNSYSDDFLKALELAEQAAPAPVRRGLGADDLAEEIGAVTDEGGNPVEGATKMRRVKGDPDWESYVTLYSTYDGKPSTVLRGMVQKKLQQRWPEEANVPEVLWGRPVFTRKPLVEYKPGNNLCFLNPDHPDHEFIVKIGLGGVTCRKRNLPTEFAARQHGEHKHGDEWKAYVEAKGLREREQSEYRTAEQNDIMRALLQQLVSQNEQLNAVKAEVVNEHPSRQRNVNDGGNVNDKRNAGGGTPD